VLSKEAADASALMYISFYSTQMSNPQITDYLSRVIQPKLATLPGMAEAQILGNQVFAMRIWLDPVKLAGFGLSAVDVTSAVRRTTSSPPPGGEGRVRGHQHQRQHRAQTADAFAALPVKTAGDSRVLLGDVARSRWAPRTTTRSARSTARRRCTSASRPPRRPTRWT
jgi:multidrug efflux pump